MTRRVPCRGGRILWDRGDLLSLFEGSVAGLEGEIHYLLWERPEKLRYWHVSLGIHKGVKRHWIKIVFEASDDLDRLRLSFWKLS